MRLSRRLTTALAAAVFLTSSVAAAQVRHDVIDPLAATGRWTANARGTTTTPPMGWNSWNAFGTLVDEAKVLGTAEALVETGLSDLGYRYVNIDDGWMLRRRQSDNRLQIRTQIFPSAAVGGVEETSFRPLVDRLHAMGLKAGIYTDIGRNTCAQSYDLHSPNLPEGSIAEREVGLQDHIDQDIDLLFWEWDFDFIKVDACGLDYASAEARRTRGASYAPWPPLVFRDSLNRTDIDAVKALYDHVGEALERANPDNDYVFSICLWGAANVRAWGKDLGNLTRTSDDIRPIWTRMLHTFDSAATRPLYAQPGSWNDPDMLFIGHGDFDADHLVEARSHFTLWAVINAPLLIGYDLRDAPQSLLDIWGNADLVRANQDSGGHQGVMTYNSDDVQIFSKTLAGTDRKIVSIFNRGLAPVDVILLAQHLRFSADAPVVLRDLWSKETLDPFTGRTTLSVAPRETRVFEAAGQRALADGYYVSELPGRVNVAHDGVVRPQADPVTHRTINPWEGTASAGSPPAYGGWGGAAADQSPYGQALSISGVAYPTGIGILANSRLEVRNASEYRTFSAKVGVDDNKPNVGASIVFQVYGDGRLLSQSPALAFGQPAFSLEADIAGVDIVELVVRQATGQAIPVSATWGEAALVHRASEGS